MRYRRIQLVVLGLSVAIPGSYAFAAEGRAAIEEVLVTARKREEDMQSVAIAVSVFDSEALRVNSITGLEDIAQLICEYADFHCCCPVSLVCGRS